MKVLVTGGLGYIGSHTVVELIDRGFDVVIADNLSNSTIGVLDHIEFITGKRPCFYKVDVAKLDDVMVLLSEEKIEAVIHFAGYKSVDESVDNPLKYYGNNLVSLISVLEFCSLKGIKKFVFSSSATIYGDNEPPLTEDMKLGETISPYGETKKICERIISDYCVANPEFSAVLLRYFNPVGAHESAVMGESPKGVPKNLLPYITKVAKGELEKLSVYGDDYETADGTCIRDYIHVCDLASAHVKAVDYAKLGCNVFNLGTGRGVSVFEMIDAFNKANNVTIPYDVVGRRAGDIAVSYADISKARNQLDWKPLKTVEDMVRDAWNYEKNKK